MVTIPSVCFLLTALNGKTRQKILRLKNRKIKCSQNERGKRLSPSSPSTRPYLNMLQLLLIFSDDLKSRDSTQVPPVKGSSARPKK